MQLKSFFRNTTSDVGLVGEQEAEYVNWRVASNEVAELYRAWVGAKRPVSPLAYAAYEAALDREERAARTYQQLVEQR